MFRLPRSAGGCEAMLFMDLDVAFPTCCGACPRDEAPVAGCGGGSKGLVFRDG